MYYAQYVSPVGNLLLTCTDQGLTGIYMNRAIPERLHDHPVLRQTALWLDGYFRGENLPVSVPIAPEGTEFQKAVWKLLLNIPYGENCSYGSLSHKVAVMMGKERMSAQAVGQAVGKNPISILIPCHRVVGARGQLTGYAGGIDRKIWLLRHEGQQGIEGLEK